MHCLITDDEDALLWLGLELILTYPLIIKHMLQITRTHSKLHSAAPKENTWHPSKLIQAKAGALSHMHKKQKTKTLAHIRAPYRHTSPPYMQPVLVAQVRMLRGERTWRSDLGGLKVLWGRRSHFLPDGEQRGKSSREGWGRWWW